MTVSWRAGPDGWSASLVTTDGSGFTSLDLDPGRELAVEITDRRRCVGYHADIGAREPCPTFAELDRGAQCEACRERDVYTGYVRGREAAGVDATYAVYLAQVGTAVKVGVTRSDSLMRRWVEQGADFAAELASDLTSTAALDYERQIADTGIRDRVRKEEKVEPPDDELLTDELAALGHEGPVRDLTDRTVYPALTCSAVRRIGRTVGTVRAVKGQIVQVEDLCVACTPGRVLQEPQQQALSRFT